MDSNRTNLHGFGDDALSRFLRRRPPERALRWAERELGAPVSGVRAYRGGSSSAIHGLRVATRTGATTVVLRRYVIERVITEEPDIVTREADVLRLLRGCAVPTPSLLAVDLTGTEAGAPAVLMSRVPGRLDWSPADLDRWLHRLAAVLPQIHATEVGDRVQEFRPYRPDSFDPPAWMKRTQLWPRALDVFHGPRLDPDRAFVHRDYHPGNVLWRRAKVSGVVDWQAASVGPRAVDVFHCRANLLRRFGLETADRFIDVWEAVTGDTYHPWSEVVLLVDAIGWLRPRSSGERDALESMLERRLAELGR